MATTKKETAAAVIDESDLLAAVAAEIKANETEMVEIRIPRASERDDPNIFIGLNSKNYLAPCGKTAKVPKCVAMQYEACEEARNHYYDTIDELVEKGK